MGRVTGVIGLALMALLPGFLRWNVVPPVQEEQEIIYLLDRDGEIVDAITDGDLVQLRYESSDSPGPGVEVRFHLDGQPVANCSIPENEQGCATEPFHSLGWYWDPTFEPAPSRALQVEIGGLEMASRRIQVRPRPVVMVHGFASDWTVWTRYLGPEGYLAELGIGGYAVGDGQFEGLMNTGNLGSPEGRTNTIQQNAAVLGAYIEQVKSETGAEMVDLLAHSMGGLISRYYIAQVMDDRDVAQLIMLGSPMAGTACANLPASLGLYLPATLEIRPSYVTGIFNPQVQDRRGVTFHALAGNPILEAFKSPCTSVPTDLAVSLNSVSAIPLEVEVMPVLHTELNTSPRVFSEYVQPLLTRDLLQFAEAPPNPTGVPAGPPVQFSRLFSGQLAPGESSELVIPIEDGVTVASFALYDSSRSLDVEVRGASGNVIELSAENNGLVVVSDPAALFYLGYGFQDPKPGEWRVKLLTTSETPPGGAAYALTAYMVGGVSLDAAALPILPQVGETVSLDAALSLNGELLPVQSARAAFQLPSGDRASQDLELSETGASLAWQPAEEGLYGIDLLVAGVLPDGGVIERTAFLAVQAQPTEPPTRITVLVVLAVLFVMFVLLALAGVWILVRRKRPQ